MRTEALCGEGTGNRGDKDRLNVEGAEEGDEEAGEATGTRVPPGPGITARCVILNEQAG
jgi:hypothetical protein